MTAGFWDTVDKNREHESSGSNIACCQVHPGLVVLVSNRLMVAVVYSFGGEGGGGEAGDAAGLQAVPLELRSQLGAVG